MRVEHHQVAVDGLTFYCASAGPSAGRPVLLLHGFPEMSYGWRHQILALARAGLHVIAPDQRGYGLSSKPRGTRAYALDALAADVVSIAAAFGHRRFSLVGHDWGGIVAWHLAARRPETVERLAILNAPHLDAFAPYLLRHPAQIAMSSYVAAFQWPGSRNSRSVRPITPSCAPRSRGAAGPGPSPTRNCASTSEPGRNRAP